eukprot:7893241-Karenia_brevis.AAC.1
MYVKWPGGGAGVGRFWGGIHAVVSIVGSSFLAVPRSGPFVLLACVVNVVSRGGVSFLDVV